MTTPGTVPPDSSTPDAATPDMATPDTAAIRAYLTGLQARIVARLEALDGGRFRTDAWERPPPSPCLFGGPTESRTRHQRIMSPLL